MDNQKIICRIDLATRSIIAEFNTMDDVKSRYNIVNKSDVQRCLNGERKICDGSIWVYKKSILDSNINLVIKSIKPNLLVDTHPDIAKEWDYKLNTLNINLITYGSGENIWWLCLININHPSYNSTVSSRTKKWPHKCPKCEEEKKEKKDKMHLLQQEIKEHTIKPHINDIKTGDESENYVVQLLKQSNLFKNIIRTGHTADVTDAVVILNSGEKKSLQIKTLSYLRAPEIYSMSGLSKYDKNMLIVGTNRLRTCLALFYQKNMEGKDNVSLPFSATKSKYKNLMFRDSKNFLDKFNELIINSTPYIGYNSGECNIKEYKSLLRLESWCINNNIRYNRRDTNCDTIDIFINDIPMQAKFCSMNGKTRSTYQIGIRKSAGMIDGIRTTMPYSINDPFHYLIVELGGIKEDISKYEGYFCFIPKQKLVEMGYISSILSEGKESMYICSPDSKLTHWSKEFWLNKTLSDEDKNNFLLKISAFGKNKPKLKLI